MSASNRTPTRRWLALSAAALLGLAGLAPTNAYAQSGGAGSSGSNAFATHWAVISKSGTTWKDEVPIPGVNVKKDVTVFYEHQFGTFPAGPHAFEGDSNFMSVHLAKVRKDIAAKIPDPNATGMGVIDYETWLPFWSMFPETVYTLTNGGQKLNIKDAWRDHIRATKPQLLAGKSAAAQEEVFKTTWLSTTRDFFEQTLKECKKMRPNMKWGIFGMPMRSYWVQFDAKKYADYQAMNDTELAWLWDLQDVFYADIYTFYYSVEGRKPEAKKYEDASTEHAGYVRSNVREAVRLA